MACWQQLLEHRIVLFESLMDNGVMSGQSYTVFMPWMNEFFYASTPSEQWPFQTKILNR